MPTKLREKLAELEHMQWAAWTEYMLNALSKNPDLKLRWKRQMNTPYSELTEKEKDSDREWADRVLQLIKNEEKGE